MYRDSVGVIQRPAAVWTGGVHCDDMRWMAEEPMQPQITGQMAFTLQLRAPDLGRPDRRTDHLDVSEHADTGNLCIHRSTTRLPEVSSESDFRKDRSKLRKEYLERRR